MVQDNTTLMEALETQRTHHLATQALAIRAILGSTLPQVAWHCSWPRCFLMFKIVR